MAMKLRLFDPADYLKNEETVTEYLRLALESGNPDELVRSLADVVRARGGNDQFSKESGLPLELLNRSLDATGNPDVATLMRIFEAIGVTLTISAKTQEPVAA